MKHVLHPSFTRLTRRAGVVCATLGLAFAAASARASDPADFPDEYGYALTGLGTGGDEVALVFTNTSYTAESPMNWTLPNGVKSIWYLVVGGGASGGSSGNAHGSGGGGAGGVVMNDAFPVSGGSAVKVSVGAGGAKLAAGANSAGNDGSASSLMIGETVITALPGAGGGKGQSAGRGDATKYACGGGAGSSITGTTTQEYAGGVGAVSNGGKTVGKTGGGGGGGGAGGDGATAAAGGTGGLGVGVTIFNDAEYRIAGGGSGPKSDWTANTSTDGGGKGRASNGSYGGQPTSGSRWGAGGGGAKNTKAAAGAGYQGVVVVRYRVLAGNEALVPTIASKAYNGEPQTADVTDGEGYYVKVNAGGVNAGDYVVTLALSNGWHWTGGSTSDTNLTFKITKIDNAWTTEPSLSKTTWELDEEAATVNAGAAASKTSVVVTYDEGASEMPLTIGGHSAIFTVAESQNYLALSKTINYTISKNTNVWTTEPSLSKTTWAFDEPAATVTVGAAKYGEVVVTYDDDPSLTELPTALGEHAVKFAVAATDTYTVLEKAIDYEVTKKVNSWTTQPVVSSFNIEDPAPVFTPPTSKFGEVVTYYDGDTSKTEMPTDLGQHSVTYKVLEGDDYTAFEQTLAYAVIYKPIVDPTNPSKVYGYRMPKLGAEQNEVALVFTNTAYSFDSPMSYSLPTYVTSVSYLVVGGGAAGGSSNNANGAGGGGAGGVVTNTEPLSVAGGLSFEVVVGAGGASRLEAGGANGKSSSLMIGESSIEALPGAGGCGSKDGVGIGGLGYACGGGAGATAGATGYNYAGGTGTISNGGTAPRGTYYVGGGGGGAGGDGAAAASGTIEGSRGGMGVPVTIFGEELWIAGGGSGSRNNDNSYPSIGGGGKGGCVTDPATSGSTWGAGGGGATVAKAYSGAGHQGVVVIRYVEDATAVAVPTIGAKVYTGELQTADVPSSSYYTVTANEGGTDVGEYPVELTLATGYHWDGGDAEPTNLVFAITQAQNEWTVEPSISKENWLATDEPGVLTNGMTKFGEVTRVIVKDGGAAEPFVSLPTAAGVYVITNIAPATTANYLAPDVLEKTVSFTIFGASETPDFTVAFDGDVSVGVNDAVVTAAVPYRVSCDVESPKLVNIHALVTLDGAAATDVTLAENVALDATGIGLLNDLKPGATYAVALYGLGAEDGKSSPTTDVVRVTTPGPATGLLASATFTNDPKEFVISGSLTPGLGTTTVYLRWSLNSSALDNLATYTFAYGDAGAFSTNIAYTALSDSLTWDVAVSNNFTSSTYGDLSWNDALAPTTKTRVDTVATIYTWTGVGGDNLWTNGANWTANRTESYGYPDATVATAKFAGDAAVNMDDESIDVSATGLNLASGISVVISNGTLKGLASYKFGASNATLTFADMTLSGFDKMNVVDYAKVVFIGNTSLTGMVRPWNCKGGALVFRDGETTISSYLNGYGSDGTSITLENALVKVGTAPNATYKAITLPLKFYGDSQLNVKTSWTLCQNCEMTIPAEGLTRAVIQTGTCTATPGTLTYSVNVSDYASGRKVPLVKFTGADQTSVMEGHGITLVAKARDKSGNLVNVTEKRNARLEWSAADNTLYYVQDGQMGFMIYIK